MLQVAEGKYAWMVKIGEKGQFVLPKEAREVFDLHPGDTILVLGDVERGIAIPPKDAMKALLSNGFDDRSEESK